VNKASFSFVVRKRNAAGAFQINTGPLWGGADGRVGLRVERVENLYEFTKAPCEVAIYEVDGRGRSWNRETEIARFGVKIRRAGTKFHFTVNSRKDTPTYENRLPAPTEDWEHWYQEPWKVKRIFRGPWLVTPVSFTTRYHNGWKPDWQPPHFFLDFNTAGNSFDKLTTVVIPRSCTQETVKRRRGVTDHFYTIGFKVFVGSQLKFRSTVLLVDCHNILAHNLQLAARGMLMAHDELIYSNAGLTIVTPGHRPPDATLLYGSGFRPLPDKTGTHYGSYWVRDGFVNHFGKKKYGKPQSDFVYRHAESKKLQYLSCMEYPLQVGQIAFAKTFGAPAHKRGGRPNNAMWRSYRAGLPKTDASFVTIVKRLVDAGWISVYFNPDTKHPHSTDRRDQVFHKRTAKQARRKRLYQGVRVHDRMIDFDINTSHPRTLQPAHRARLTEQQRQIKKVEFGFIITADARHGHCAMLIKGKVYEVHYDRGPDDCSVFDASRDFEDWAWGSGLFVVPRGQWPVP
jgi:hypothetical protein